jgi:hypothetical protein
MFGHVFDPFTFACVRCGESVATLEALPDGRVCYRRARGDDGLVPAPVWPPAWVTEAWAEGKSA